MCLFPSRRHFEPKIMMFTLSLFAFCTLSIVTYFIVLNIHLVRNMLCLKAALVVKY